MRAIHRARASLFGLFHHDGLYDRLISRGFRSLYAKVTTDVVSATPAGGTRVLDVGTGPGRVPSRSPGPCRGCGSRASICPLR